MSKGTSKSNHSTDLWLLVEVERVLEKYSAKPTENDESEENNTVLFIGDCSTGKSSIIQSFLKPNSVIKDPKPTVALDYNFARKKSSNGKGKIVAHIWELSGIEPNETKLLEIPITNRSIMTSSIVLCVDLSKPHQILANLQKWIKNIRDIIRSRLSDINPSAVYNGKSFYTGHVDEMKVSPLEIPFYLFANKYDIWKSSQQGDKRVILQILRFFAHYYGATLIATSTVEPSMKESFKSIISSIHFTPMVSKTAYELNIDRPFYITPGQDDYESILMGRSKDMPPATAAAIKSKLLQSEAEISQYVTSNGLTKDCWARLAEHLRSVFGDPEVPSTSTSVTNERDEFETKDNNDYPEPDVDNMRAQRDLMLEKYIQEKQRREQTIQKMNQDDKRISEMKANSTTSTSSSSKSARK